MRDRIPPVGPVWMHGFVLVAVSLTVAACGVASGPLEGGAEPTVDIGVPDAGTVSEAASTRARLVVLGDSLTAGLGLPPDQAFPARLQERLDAAGYAVDVVSAGVSGDTTAGGLRRLDWTLDESVEYLIVALGGNDGLRGLPIEQMRDNLDAIITTARARGIAVLLAGMEAPPNFGTVYTDRFRLIFRDLAERHDVVFVPFLLDGVAGDDTLNQADGIHPNATGAARVADHLFPSVVELLAGGGTRSSSEP